MRKRAFNIAAGVSLGIFLLGVADFFFEQHVGVSVTTPGSTAVKHTLAADGWFITFENEDQLNPAQLAAALKRLRFGTEYDGSQAVKVEGYYYDIWNFGILTTERGHLTVDPVGLWPGSSSGVVCGHRSRVVVPLAVPLVLASIMPVMVGTRAWRLTALQRRRNRVGLCRNCSYNLTGNTSGVCPECGNAIAGRR